MCTKLELFHKAQNIIQTTYLQAYWQAYNVTPQWVDDMMKCEIAPHSQGLQSLEQVLAFAQEKTGYSPYFIFNHTQIEELYQIYQKYLSTFILKQ